MLSGRPGTCIKAASRFGSCKIVLKKNVVFLKAGIAQRACATSFGYSVDFETPAFVCLPCHKLLFDNKSQVKTLTTKPHDIITWLHDVARNATLNVCEKTAVKTCVVLILVSAHGNDVMVESKWSLCHGTRP